MKTHSTLLRKFLLFSWAIWFVGLNLITASELSMDLIAEAATTESISCQVCRIIPGLSPSQQDICCDNPTAILLLDDTEHRMRTECRWQLRKELWNCSEIGMPIFRPPQLRETREKAFIYALAAATTAHRITTACSAGELGAECGCDYSRNGLITVQGWQWGSCSDNVTFGVNYAQRFLDSREIDVDNTNVTATEHASVHLHNNAVGVKVLLDNMRLSCRCHGLSGSCAVKTCWRELPSYYTVGDILKAKYDHALNVTISPTDKLPLHYDHHRRKLLIPSVNSLIYLEKQANYCSVMPNFTQNRECLPQAMLDAQRRGEVKAQTSSEYFPPCEEFCCDGEYQREVTTVTKTCNCRFVWCCNVECQTCTTNITTYKCTG